MEERNIKYFEDRLGSEKESYTPQEVAKLLHSEAEYTERTTKKGFEGYVPQEQYNDLQTKTNALETEIKPYREAEFNTTISTAFAKFNGNVERLDDLKKLGGFKGGESPEDVEKTITGLKDTGNYAFLFTENNSGGVNQPQPGKGKGDKAIVKGDITPKVGGFLDNIFTKKTK